MCCADTLSFLLARHQQLIGRPELVLSSDSQPLVVATEQNVLAAVRPQTGVSGCQMGTGTVTVQLWPDRSIGCHRTSGRLHCLELLANILHTLLGLLVQNGVSARLLLSHQISGVSAFLIAASFCSVPQMLMPVVDVISGQLAPDYGGRHCVTLRFLLFLLWF